MKDSEGNNHYAVAPFDDSVDGRSWTQLCAAECGVNESAVIDVVAWYEEHFKSDCNGESWTQGQRQVVTQKTAELLIGFKNPWLGIRLLLYALDIPAIDEVLKYQCPKDFGHETSQSKQNANKLLKEIQSALNLKPRRGQRRPDTRKKQSDKRKSGLTPKLKII